MVVSTTRSTFCLLLPERPRLLAFVDLLDLRLLLAFLAVELFFRAPESLPDLLFELAEEDFFEGAASAGIPTAPKQIIATSGKANLKILITSNNRKGRGSWTCSGRFPSRTEGLRREPFEGPAGAILQAIAEPVMQPIGTALPELDRVRLEPITAPVRREWNIRAGEAG